MNDLHPYLVHFPLALFISTFILGLVGIVYQRNVIKELLFWNILLGVLFGIGAILSGIEALKKVFNDPLNSDLVQAHERNAFILVIFFSLLCIWSGFRRKNMKSLEYSSFVFILLLGAFTAFYQLHTGTEMVYKEGIGIPKVEEVKRQMQELKDAQSLEDNPIYE